MLSIWIHSLPDLISEKVFHVSCIVCSLFDNFFSSWLGDLVSCREEVSYRSIQIGLLLWCITTSSLQIFFKTKKCLGKFWAQKLLLSHTEDFCSSTNMQRKACILFTGPCKCVVGSETDTNTISIFLVNSVCGVLIVAEVVCLLWYHPPPPPPWCNVEEILLTTFCE